MFKQYCNMNKWRWRLFSQSGRTNTDLVQSGLQHNQYNIPLFVKLRVNIFNQKVFKMLNIFKKFIYFFVNSLNHSSICLKQSQRHEDLIWHRLIYTNNDKFWYLSHGTVCCCCCAIYWQVHSLVKETVKPIY